MNCSRAEAMMSAYLDSELSGAEMLAIRRHMSTCDDCSQEYSRLAQLQAVIADSAARLAPRPASEYIAVTRSAKRLVPVPFGASLIAATAIAAGFAAWSVHSTSSAGTPERRDLVAEVGDDVYVGGSDVFAGGIPIVPTAYPGP